MVERTPANRHQKQQTLLPSRTTYRSLFGWRAGNLFATLADLPGAPRGLSGVTAAVLSVGRTDEELIILGSRTRTRTVEGLFQSDCSSGAPREWQKVRPGLAADNAR